MAPCQAEVHGKCQREAAPAAEAAAGAQVQGAAGVQAAVAVVAAAVARELRMDRADQNDKVTTAMNRFNVIDAVRRIASLFLLLVPLAAAAVEQQTFARPSRRWMR